LIEEPKSIYWLYKQSEYVENRFNVYKNDLKDDRSYLRDDCMMFAYISPNLLSLSLHSQILNLMDAKYSLRDVLYSLSRINIYTIEKRKTMSEVQKKTKDQVSGINIDLGMLCERTGVKGLFNNN
jgi:transposase